MPFLISSTMAARECSVAVPRVLPLSGCMLNYRTLRAHGVEAGKVRKNGKGYEYLSRFITDLSGNYLTTQESMDLLKMPRSTFFAWRRSVGVDCIQIGNVGLYSRDVILRKKRGG